MKKFATGTTLVDEPTIAEVGENGPEIISPANGSGIDTGALPLPLLNEAPDDGTLPPPKDGDKRKLERNLRFLADPNPDAGPSAPRKFTPPPAPTEIPATPPEPALPNPSAGAQPTIPAQSLAAATAGTPAPPPPPPSAAAVAAQQANQNLQEKGKKVESVMQGRPGTAPDNWAQRLGLAALSLTRFAPIANQLIHPKWASQQRAYQSQLGGVSDEYQQASEEQKAANTAMGTEALAAQRDAAAEQKRALAQNYQNVERDRATAQADKEYAGFMNQVKAIGGIPIAPGEAVPQGYYPMQDPRNPNLTWVSPHAFMTVPPELADKFPGQTQVPSDTYAKGLASKWADDLEKAKLAGKPEPAGAAKQAFQSTLTKLATENGLPASAMTDVSQLSHAIDTSKTLSPQEKASAKAYLAANTTPESSGSTALMRALAMGQTREYPVINKTTGQLEMRNAQEINSSNGGFAPAGPGAQAMSKNAVFQDLHYNIDTARKAIQALDSMDVGTRAALSYNLRHTDPKSSIETFLTGAAGTAMTPQQQEAVQAMALLAENAMTLRNVAGMGAGSDDLRAAIQATIPSGKSPTKGYALEQLNKFENVVKRLETGIPGMQPHSGQQHAPAGNPNPNAYVVGHRYGGMTYLGPDPNNPASWQK